MNLEEARAQLDNIDDQIVVLFNERMDMVEEVIKAKAEEGVAVSDPNREAEILARVATRCTDDRKEGVKRLFTTLFEVSKDAQRKSLD